MKKVIKYVGSIFSTFGVLTPLIVISLAYVILISLERNNAIVNLFNNNRAWFIALFVIVALALAACIFFYFINLHKENIIISDLVLLIVFILVLLLLVLFCFHPGFNFEAMSIFKWILGGCLFITSIIFIIVRARIKG